MNKLSSLSCLVSRRRAVLRDGVRLLGLGPAHLQGAAQDGAVELKAPQLWVESKGIRTKQTLIKTCRMLLGEVPAGKS